jgi:outer membrane immunogenic protein
MFRLSITLIAAVSSLGLIGVASAADLPVKGPVYKAPVAEPLYNWTGTYIGIAGGYGWGQSNQTDPGIPCGFFGSCGGGIKPDGNGDLSMQGGMIGGTLGYNWQQGPWVFGAEGDFSWADISGSSNTCGANSPAPHPCGSKLESLGTLRARIGYAMGATDNWLPYVTGGLAVGELKAWDAFYPSSGSDFRAGWTVGGGVETAITRNWTFKVEYLYVDLGSRELFYVVPGVQETVSFKASILRAGINYRF